MTVNCLLMFYFVYCNNCDLKNVSEACFYICSIIALCLPKMYLWPVNTRKKPKLLEMHTCHWTGAQMWFRHEWKKLVTASLLLHSTDGLLLPPFLEWVFFSCVSGFRLSLSCIAFWRKRLQLVSKSDLTTNGVISGYFCCGMTFFGWLNISVDSNQQQLLFFTSFVDINFLMFSLRGGFSGVFFKNACAFYPQDNVISIDKL